MSETEILTINNKLDSITKWRTEVTDELKGFRKTLYGNGVPGWDEILRTLYADYLERKQAEKEVEKRGKEIDKEKELTGVKGKIEIKIAAIGGLFVIANSLVTLAINLVVK